MLNTQKNVQNATNQLRNTIRWNGIYLEFKMPEIDEYGQITGNKEIRVSLQGIFHVERGYITITTSDGSRMQSKPQPMFLFVSEKNTPLPQKNDEVVYNSVLYRVEGVENVIPESDIYDVSLYQVE